MLLSNCIAADANFRVFEKFNTFIIFECEYAYSNMVEHKYYFESDYKTFDFSNALGLFQVGII